MKQPTGDQDRSDLDLMLRGFQVSRMLRLVADIGVADRIARDGHVALADLAAACGVLPGPLLRIIRALAAFGVFRIDPDGTIHHTARSILLRTDTPMSMHHAARFWTAPGSWAAWGRLDAALTGGVPHEAAWNTGRFEYLRAHPDEARGFDAMMANFPDNRHAAIAETFDFSQARLITDIGGGNGTAMRHILARFPTARGRVFDRPDVVGAIASEDLMDGRIEVQGGSFFDGVPTGSDFYTIIRVLHDWSDEDCVRILRSCRAAAGSDARLLVVDQLLEPDPMHGDPAGYLIDMQMMAMFGAARERTEAEFRDILAAAGFALRRVLPTPSAVWILEAVPV